MSKKLFQLNFFSLDFIASFNLLSKMISGLFVDFFCLSMMLDSHHIFL